MAKIAAMENQNAEGIGLIMQNNVTNNTIEAAMENAVGFIQSCYALLEKNGISLNMLIIAAVVLVFALLFAAREAVSWFMKIDVVRRDIKKLRLTIERLEGEVRATQAQLTTAKDQRRAHDGEPTIAHDLGLKAAGEKSPGGFTINH